MIVESISGLGVVCYVGSMLGGAWQARFGCVGLVEAW